MKLLPLCERIVMGILELLSVDEPNFQECLSNVFGMFIGSKKGSGKVFYIGRQS